MTKLFLFFLVVFVSAGCSRDIISYIGSIDVALEYEVVDNVLNDEYVFSWPRDIFVHDSLLIVHDSNMQEHAFHAFDRYSGRHLADFGLRGRGPGEVANVSSVNLYKDSLVVYDSTLKKLVCYDIHGLFSGTAVRWSEHKLDADTGNTVLQVIPAGDDRYILAGNTDAMRFGVWNPGDKSLSKDVCLFPAFTDDEETNWSIANYVSSMRFCNGFFVTATYIGGVLEIYEATGCLALKSAGYYYKPEYGYAKGASPKWVTTDDDTVVGFQNISLSENGIYALVWGVECSDLEDSRPSVVLFGYDGNPVCRYDMPDAVVSIAVAPDGTLYGMALNEDMEFNIKEHKIIL